MLQRRLTCCVNPSPPDPLSPKRGEGEKESVMYSHLRRGEGEKRDLLQRSYLDLLLSLDEGDNFA
jgi:hypothetical protein